jgi:hypothetical protein
MDIHKPKPWHGMREFLKEYVIIVVGVLTALAAEAVVQNLHERRLSAEAREAVRAELNTNITVVGRRMQTEDCVSRRLDEIVSLLDQAERGETLRPRGLVGGPSRQLIATQRWQAATAGGRTSLLTSDEQADLARVYNALNAISQDEHDEEGAWGQLRALHGAGRLSQGVIDAERLAVSTARLKDFLAQQDFRQAQFYAQRVGVKGDAKLVLAPFSSLKDPHSANICRSLTEPN